MLLGEHWQTLSLLWENVPAILQIQQPKKQPKRHYAFRKRPFPIAKQSIATHPLRQQRGRAKPGTVDGREPPDGDGYCLPLPSKCSPIPAAFPEQSPSHSCNPGNHVLWGISICIQVRICLSDSTTKFWWNPTLWIWHQNLTEHPKYILSSPVAITNRLFPY